MALGLGTEAWEEDSGTHSTQSAYAREMDSLARTRKLPSLPALDSSSSALERVMLPWFQLETMVGVGLLRWRPAACPLRSPLLLPPASLTA